MYLLGTSEWAVRPRVRQLSAKRCLEPRSERGARGDDTQEEEEVDDDADPCRRRGRRLDVVRLASRLDKRGWQRGKCVCEKTEKEKKERCQELPEMRIQS